MGSPLSTEPLNLLIIGDVVGSPGREALKRCLPLLRDQHHIHACIANGENAAGGFGLTAQTAEEMFENGVDFITGGNHIFDKRDFVQYLESSGRVLRPANYPPGVPGRGAATFSADGVTVGVLNLMGRTFMPPVDDPFRCADELVPDLRASARVLVVDVHAEATSEKIALGRYLDGRVSCVVGTHTHVQTADEQILPSGTAYLSDLGMTGPTDGIIGMEGGAVLDRFLRGLSDRFSVERRGPKQLCGAVVAIDRISGKANDIKRIFLKGIA
ncbi:MAG: TIGR00282 family metallophosphoesterase [Candidatus Eremiobacteraeota bacterium]|nr:TIGR00282 family metallophosphoesterase [Candidatus Eremiobacteraeota bacterium]MBV9700987.1 TIGR00282 family metallophosphoesterase [Candidatus Eremiobacteraeota bacterium]